MNRELRERRRRLAKRGMGERKGAVRWRAVSACVAGSESDSMENIFSFLRVPRHGAIHTVTGASNIDTTL